MTSYKCRHEKIIHWHVRKLDYIQIFIQCIVVQNLFPFIPKFFIHFEYFQSYYKISEAKEKKEEKIHKSINK